MDSVHIFKAKDFKNAFKTALKIGKGHEEEYKNGYGEEVRWRFKEIISLDIIQEENLDGAEIYSEPVDIPSHENFGFDAIFTPDKSDPTQTI